MVQVPLMRRAGEAEAGLVVGTAKQQPEIGGTLRVAPSDHVRIGASIAAATRSEERAFVSGASRDTPKLFGDGFVGAEWGGWIFRYGALVGSGFGSRSMRGSGCRLPAQGACVPASASTQQYVRSYGQLHLAVAPPGPLVGSLAVRVPAIVELPGEARGRHTRVGVEVALTQSVMLRHVRLDLQPLWSRIEGFAFHLSFLFRFQPGR
jgi:hypothetical protein